MIGVYMKFFFLLFPFLSSARAASLRRDVLSGSRQDG